MLPHAPYSPDMSPLDFHLFPKLKESMRGWRFSSLEELSTDDTLAIRHMYKSDVLDGIIIFPKHWDSVVGKQRDYIEGLWTNNIMCITLEMASVHIQGVNNIDCEKNSAER